MKKEILTKVSTIIAICIATVALVLGFVTVNKLSKVKEPKNTTKFNVVFEEKTLKATTVGTTSIDNENTKISGDNITSIIGLKIPGDGVIYTWDIVNNGNVTAVLDKNPILLGLNNNDKQAVDIEVLINDEKAKKGTEIKAGETATAKMVVTYKQNAPTIIDSTKVQVISATLSFRQK